MTGQRTTKRLFISHKHSDADVAMALQNLLTAAIGGLDAGQIVRTSGADTGIRAGAYITATLLEDIRSCNAFVALMSEAYLTSPYCLMEYAAWLGLHQDTPPVPLQFPDLDMDHLLGMLPGAKLADITAADAIAAELAGIAESGVSDEWSLKEAKEFDPQLKRLIRAARHKRPRRWLADNFLIRDKHADFLNVYGLETDLRKDGVVQDFSAPRTCSPVQFTWADPEAKGSRISARWLDEGVLRLDFRYARYGCDVSIRPLRNRAVLASGRKWLHILARVAPKSKLREIGVNVRLVNGYMQHWALMTDSENERHLVFDSEEFQERSVPLDADGEHWGLFTKDGTGKRGPEKPDFSVIAGINLSPGRPSGGIRRVRNGCGMLDIQRIWLT